jgi:hypothetical protein
MTPPSVFGVESIVARETLPVRGCSLLVLDLASQWLSSAWGGVHIKPKIQRLKIRLEYERWELKR